MSGNTIGKIFTVTTFGESHGPAIGCVIDGCPPGLAFSTIDIQSQLDRRRPGTSPFVTQRQELDKVQILSGWFEGKSTGTPIALLIQNTDQHPGDYAEIAQSFRPGHADYTYWHKYGVRDYRGGGRSSARLTAPLVAAGAIAKIWLNRQYGVEIRGYLAALGKINIPFESWSVVSSNPFFSPSTASLPQLEEVLHTLRRNGDSVGARVNIIASNVPVGWGEPVFDRLDADLAHALMSINAVKGVEIGDGFNSIQKHGSEYGDELTKNGFVGNRAGGILGGISSGQDIVASIAIKPTSSIRIARRSINIDGNQTMVRTIGRHDPCVGIRATPIAEAMVALVLIDHALRYRAQCSDVRVETACVVSSI